MDQRDRRIGNALTLSAGISFGALPLFVTWLGQAGVGVWLQVVVRLAVSIILFGGILQLVMPGPVRLSSTRQLRFVMLNGLLIMAAFTTYVLSISLGTPPAKAILLMYLYPIYVVLMASKILGERITPRRGVGIGVGVLGAVLMVGVSAIREVGQVRIGDLFAVANGVIYGSMMVMGRIGSVRQHMRPLVQPFWSFSFALLWLLLAGGIALLLGGEQSLFMQMPDSISLRTLADFLGIATLGTAVPYGLVYAGLHRTEAATTSILLLVEPVSVAVMAMIFLHQPVDIWQVVGGAFILTAGVLAAK